VFTYAGCGRTPSDAITVAILTCCPVKITRAHTITDMEHIKAIQQPSLPVSNDPYQHTISSFERSDTLFRLANCTEIKSTLTTITQEARYEDLTDSFWEDREMYEEVPGKNLKALRDLGVQFNKILGALRTASIY
jgi:hypothetical protein